MLRRIKTSVVAALCCTVVGAGLAGCDSDAMENWDPLAAPTAQKTAAAPISGIKKITVEGKSVNVSCSGVPKRGKPVVVLLHGAGDGVDKLAALQKTLSKKNQVCSYDRLGAGASDQPDGPQSIAGTGKILTGVLDQVAGGLVRMSVCHVFPLESGGLRGGLPRQRVSSCAVRESPSLPGGVRTSRRAGATSAGTRRARR